MPTKTSDARLTVPLTRASIETLASLTVLDRRGAETIAVESLDEPVSPALATAAAEAIARFITAGQLCWPATPSDLRNGLERLGVKRAAAKEVVDFLLADATIREAAEQPS